MGVEPVLGRVHSVEEAVTAIKNLPRDIYAIFRIPSGLLAPRNNELSQAAISKGIPMGVTPGRVGPDNLWERPF